MSQHSDLELNVTGSENFESVGSNNEARQVIEGLRSHAPFLQSPPQGMPTEFNYLERLVAEYLGPRIRARSQDWAYDDRILSGSRIRDMNIARIQHDILNLQHKLASSGECDHSHLELLSVLLHEQAEAVRDREYMARTLVQVSNQTYMESVQKLYPNIKWDGRTRIGVACLKEDFSVTKRLHTFLMEVLPTSWTWSKAEQLARPFDFAFHTSGEKDARYMPRSPTIFTTVVASVILSLTSAAFIIVPISVMSFRPTATKSLVTTSASVILFGFFLAAVVRVKSSEAFIATATYTAVLVVFFGAKSSGALGA